MTIRAYTIRGLAGSIFSRGMDALAAKLNAAGVRCTVHAHGLFRLENVPRIAADALRAAKAGARVVLVGHSYGGDAALTVANRLHEERVPVPLLVAFDPTWFGAPPVPANVARAIGFYQKVDPVGRGVLRAGDGFSGALINERHDEPHVRIDDDPALHARVIAEVAKLRQPA